MADEHKPKDRKKLIEPETEGSAVRTPAGKTASPAGIAEPAPTPLQTKSMKQPKLEKKNKSRLPRRQKKARQKAATQGEI
jgi:hypothetical protein